MVSNLHDITVGGGKNSLLETLKSLSVCPGRT
jgi:hypothetical protein